MPRPTTTVRGILARAAALAALVGTAALAPFGPADARAGAADGTGTAEGGTIGANTAGAASRAAIAQQTFDAVWATVRDTHWDPAFNGVDWDAVRTELLPKAMACADDACVRAAIMEALGRLGQSHFAVIPADTAGGADAGARRAGRSGASIAFLERENQPGSPGRPGEPGSSSRPRWDAVIVAVEPGSPADRAGLAPGMSVRAIAGRDPAAKLPPGDGLERHERASIGEAAATGEPGTSAVWEVEPLGGTRRTVDVGYEADARPTAKFGNLPPLPTDLSWRHLDETERERWGGGRTEIGLIRFNIWLIPIARAFDAAMDGLRGSDGIVIDLRGNPGGIGAMAMGIAGHFTAESVPLGEMRSRDTVLRFVTNPRAVDLDGKPTAPFAGPVAIVVDEGTASTSEIFAGGMQHLKRARVFGTRTAGAALPALTEKLPNGDVFLHAVADYRLPDGTALEATGVRPERAAPYARADYAREGDPAMADAVRWIAAEKQAAKRAASSAPAAPAETTERPTSGSN
jgi:carboxyl-terminal processing protease